MKEKGKDSSEKYKEFPSTRLSIGVMDMTPIHTSVSFTRFE